MSYDDRELPRIAERALQDDPPHASVRPADIIRWAVTTRSLGVQPITGPHVGQPYLTMYTGRRFFIEVLFWFDSTLYVHQHSFDGAFAVMAGSSLHSIYDFHEQGRTSTRLLVGDVVHRQTEHLKRGAVRPIHSGRSFIHSFVSLGPPVGLRRGPLFHLTGRWRSLPLRATLCGD